MAQVQIWAQMEGPLWKSHGDPLPFLSYYVLIMILSEKKSYILELDLLSQYFHTSCYAECVKVLFFFFWLLELTMVNVFKKRKIRIW